MHTTRGYTLASLLQFIALVALIFGWVVAFKPHFDGSTDVRALAVSLNGKFVAIGFADRTARVWNTESTRPIATLRLSRELGFGPPPLCAISDDGKSLTIVDAEAVTLWDVPRNQLTAEFAWNQWSYEDKISQAGNRILALQGAGGPCIVRLNGRADATIESSLTGGIGPTSVTTLSADGGLLAAATFPFGGVEVRELKSGNICPINELMQPLDALAFSPDGRYLAGMYSGSDGAADSVIVCDLTNNNRTAHVNLQSEFHPFRYRPPGPLVFSSDARRFGVASGSGLEVYDIESQELSNVLGNEYFDRVASSADGKQWITVGIDHIHIWDSTTLQETSRIRIGTDGRVLGVLLFGTIVWMAVWLWRRLYHRRVPCTVCGKKRPPMRGRAPPICWMCHRATMPIAKRRWQSVRDVAILLPVLLLWGLVLSVGCGIVYDLAGSPWVYLGIISVPLLGVLGFAGFLVVRGVVMLRSMRNIEYDLRTARRLSGGDGATIVSGNVTAWFADDTTLAATLDEVFARSRDRFQALVGVEPTLDRPLRIIDFRREEDLARYLRRFGVRAGEWPGLYLRTPASKALLSEVAVRAQLEEVGNLLGSCLSHYFMEGVVGPVVPAWLDQGVSVHVAHGDDPSVRDRRDRKLLAALARGDLLSTDIFDSASLRRLFGSRTSHRHNDFVFASNFSLQAWSLVDYLAGVGAGEVRRAAFLASLDDLRTGREVAAAIAARLNSNPEGLLADWRTWLAGQQPGPHLPPPEQHARTYEAELRPLIVSPETPQWPKIRAIRAIGASGYFVGVEILKTVVNDPATDPAIREAATWSLEALGAT